MEGLVRFVLPHGKKNCLRNTGRGQRGESLCARKARVTVRARDVLAGRFKKNFGTDNRRVKPERERLKRPDSLHLK